MNNTIDYKRLYELSIIEKEELLNNINEFKKNIEELEFIDRNNVSIYYEIDNIEFYLNFSWEFVHYNEDEYEAKIDVYAEDCQQWINGINHPYFPNAEEMREIKAKIEDIISEDYFSYGLSEWIEGQRPDRDYYNEY